MRKLILFVLLIVGLGIAQPGHWGPGVNADLLQGKDTAALAVLARSNTFTASPQIFTGSASTNSAPLGAELLTAGGWTVGAGWTEAPTGTFTHTSGGGTATLSHSATIGSGKRYTSSWKITPSSPTGIATASLGGESTEAPFNYVFGPLATTTAGFTFTPTDNFNGAISAITLKEITGTSTPFISLVPVGSYTAEIRNVIGGSGLSSLFFGASSGSYNTVGLGNTGFGTSALRYNSTGNINTAIGHTVLRNNTTGFYNVGVGGGVLYFNISGSWNTAVGVLAMNRNTRGSYNTAFGEQALGYNTTGSCNQSDGYEANWLNTTGSYNSSTGWKSLHRNITGNYNTAFGGYSGTFLANGSSACTASVRSVFVGYNSKALTAADTNEIVIGSNAVGAGTNTVVIGDTLITKTVLRGRDTGYVAIRDTFRGNLVGSASLLQTKDTTALFNAKTLQGKDTTALERVSQRGVAGGYAALPNPLDSTLGLCADGVARVRPVGLFFEHDMLTVVGGHNFPWYAEPTAAGTWAAIAPGSPQHPGVARTSSSTSSNSGYRLIIYLGGILLGGSETTDFIFRPQTLALTTIRFGFHDATSATDADDGCYLESVAGLLVGKTARNTTRSTTGTSYQMVTNTWYRARIILNADATRVDFYLFAEDGTLLWTDFLTTNIPTDRETGHGIVATNSGTTAVALVDTDYMNIWIARALVR